MPAGLFLWPLAAARADQECLLAATNAEGSMGVHPHPPDLAPAGSPRIPPPALHTILGSCSRPVLPQQARAAEREAARIAAEREAVRIAAAEAVAKAKREKVSEWIGTLRPGCRNLVSNSTSLNNIQCNYCNQKAYSNNSRGITHFIKHLNSKHLINITKDEINIL